MITIQSKNIHPKCEVWLSRHDMTISGRIASLYQELGIIRKLNKPQQDSDLEIYTLPFYACKVPSVFFFPYVNYYCGNWFTPDTNFIIPTTPLNRIHGKYWLNNIALPPTHLVNPQYSESKYRLGWIAPDGKINPDYTYSHAEIISLASAAETYFLDEIRYVYDETKSTLDQRKNNEPSRYCFNESIASFEKTKEYLTWYISIFNIFFDKLLKIGEQEEKERQTQFLVAGWTINRLAVDALTIASTDAPYVRKWQFFGFLDAFANLINQTTLEKSGPKEDAKKFSELLTMSFFQNNILPSLKKIPVFEIREELLVHTQSIYETIEGMETKYDSKDGKPMSGQKLLRAYRNSRHGYAITDNERRALIAHDGKISDNLPDLSIALWHYLILEFPFRPL